ncbi:MAG TPA: NAD(P)/FAD-dependent oxidoreductase [Methanocorpusculum sp.]|nr:NAD(P)/FAD-dependent oxidoreductase [Methanocorpusculum sp.]
MYDVVVLGAGPVGNTAARYCADLGLKTLVVEEHGTIGYPVQCAGLLSNAAFAECGVSNHPVLRTVSGAKIFGSNDAAPLSFDAGVTKAYVVDRGMLDRETAERAGDVGADFRMKTAVVRVSEEKKVLYTASGDEISYRVLIAADGPWSVAAKSFGVLASPYVYSGIQAEVTYPVDTPQVCLYPHFSPDFFAWVIPVSSTRSRIGLCGTRDVPARFAAFTRYLQVSGKMELVTGTVPVGVRKRICGPSWMLAGDAAGFPKPTSGGGIYTGLRSARHAADTALDALESGNTSAYAARCQDDFGRELETGLQILKFRRGLATADVDHVLETLNTPAILDLITKYGDIDKPSHLFRQLIRRPELLRLGSIGMKGLFRMFFAGN